MNYSGKVHWAQGVPVEGPGRLPGYFFLLSFLFSLQAAIFTK